MPFDSTPAETKPDVFSLRGFLSWVEKMPREGEYTFTDNRNCVLCQYLKSHGYRNVTMAGWGIGSADGIAVVFAFESGPDDKTVAAGFPRTFGAAADRARAMLAKEVA